MNIGNTIQQLRKEKGYSQVRFADLVDLSQTALSQIETGASTPKKETLKRICEELKVSEYLLYLLSLGAADVPEKNRSLYDALYPTLRELMLKIFKEEENNAQP